MSLALWQQCLDYLQDELNSQQFNTWIRPLQAEEGESNELCLLAPNRFVRDWVNDKYAKRISELVRELAPAKPPKVSLTVGSRRVASPAPQTRELGAPVSASPAVSTPSRRSHMNDEREIRVQAAVMFQATFDLYLTLAWFLGSGFLTQLINFTFVIHVTTP